MSINSIIFNDVNKLEGEENLYSFNFNSRDILNFYKEGLFDIDENDIKEYGFNIIKDDFTPTVIHLNLPLDSKIEYSQESKELKVSLTKIEIMDGLTRIASIIETELQLQKENKELDVYLIAKIHNLDDEQIRNII